MKVQTRLSLSTSIIFGIIFVVSSVFIYGLFQNSATRAIYRNLQKMAFATAFFYFGDEEMTDEESAMMHQQFGELVGTTYQIYDVENTIRFGLETSKITSSLLEEIREKQELPFVSDGYFCYAIFCQDRQGDFVVVAKQNREVLSTKLHALLRVLGLALVLGILVVILSSRWIARMAYRPFSKVINQVKNISTQDLNVQIQSSQTADELQALIDTFNELLTKISETVVIQKNFVRYVSHEFKTPLAALLGNLEVFAIKERNPDEYKILAEKLMQQIQQMEKIIDTLLVVSDLRQASEPATAVRLDELIWDIIDQLKHSYPNSKALVNMNIEPIDIHLLNIHKDETQLLMALFNLIENAVKYSRDHSVEIELFKRDGNLCLTIADKGIGIPADQIQHISKPFYRADNANQIQGSGIGLSIALRILERNGIHYEIRTQEQEGVTVVLVFGSHE